MIDDRFRRGHDPLPGEPAAEAPIHVLVEAAVAPIDGPDLLEDAPGDENRPETGRRQLVQAAELAHVHVADVVVGPPAAVPDLVPDAVDHPPELEAQGRRDRADRRIGPRPPHETGDAPRIELGVLVEDEG